MKNDGKPIITHCNTCMVRTRHTIMQSHHRAPSPNEESGSEGWKSEDYLIVQCRGCDDVSFLIYSWKLASASEVVSGAPPQRYPPPIFRRLPTWATNDQRKLNETFPHVSLLVEIYRSFQADAPQLAVMGIRALIERIMIEKVGDHKSFFNNLKEFERAGYISTNQKSIVERVIEVGHAAMHRGHEPSTFDLIQLLDIMEPLIDTIYFSEARLKAIAKPPPRKH